MNFKFKTGDHVVIKKSNVEQIHKFAGKTGVVTSVEGNHENDYPYLITVDGSGDTHHVWCTVERLVEEKKVFTKDDIKTGMFGVMSNGDKFVVVDDLIVYRKGGFDSVTSLDNDLKFRLYQIDKLYSNCKSFYQLDDALGCKSNNPKCVYDRERDTKPALYNGKVVCVDAGANIHFYTVGKIYQFVDGVLTSDNDIPVRNYGKPFTSFEEWSKWTGSKFIEIKE